MLSNSLIGNGCFDLMMFYLIEKASICEII